MQTFLPYSDFKKSASVLDYRRLGKQRVEALQIARCISGISNGWKNHPAVKMWQEHLNSLIDYGVAMCDEWIRRGYKDTCRDKLLALFDANLSSDFPEWFGDERLHISHQSNLIRKMPDFYLEKFSDIPPDLPYFWPITKK